MSIKEFQNIFPSLTWVDYFNEFLTQRDKITEDEVIILSDTSTFVKLNKLLESTSKRYELTFYNALTKYLIHHRTVANYLMWRVSKYSADFLHEAVRKRALEFQKVKNGKKDYGPRWKECIAKTGDVLSLVTGAIYVRKYFDEKSRNAAVEMVDTIEKQFIKIIKSVSWMDEMTKNGALKKMETFVNIIGFSNELLDDEKLIEYHENLEIKQHKYFDSFLQSSLFKFNKRAKKFRAKVNKSEWDSHPKVAVANAFYEQWENSISK